MRPPIAQGLARVGRALRAGACVWAVLGPSMVRATDAARAVVRDDLGQQVHLAGPARRIVSLAPHATELVYAVGAGNRLVGVIEHSDHPPEARRIRRVGDSRSIDLEAVAALRPDLVIVWPSGNPAGPLERLEKMGLVLYRSEPRRLDDIAGALERLGAALGQAAQASQQARAFEQELAGLRRAHAGRPPVRTFYQVWSRPLMTLNDRHLASDVIRLCGGVNVFGALTPLVPTVSIEAVLQAAPQSILVSAPPGSTQAAEQIQAWRHFRGVPAVARGHVEAVDPDLLNRPTPRVLIGARHVCEALERARTAPGPGR